MKKTLTSFRLLLLSIFITTMAFAPGCKKDAKEDPKKDAKEVVEHNSVRSSKERAPKTSDANPTHFTVHSAYLYNGYISVNQYNPTNIKIDLWVYRTSASSNMYGSGDLKYSVIYLDQQGNEATLTNEVTVTGSDYNTGTLYSNGYGTLSRVLDVTIPPGLAGGYVTLKFKRYIDANSAWEDYYRTMNRYETSFNTAQTPPSKKAPLGGPAGNYPVYEYRLSSGGCIYIPRPPDEEPGNYYIHYNSNYLKSQFQKAKFRVFPTQQPGTVPIHEWEWYLSKNENNKDFYYSTNAYAIRVGDNGWKVFRADRFYAYTYQEAGTVPVHRYYDTRVAKYYMTADPAEIASLNGNGNYRKEGIVFYAFPI
ncbi:MAG TPA: hypothetical protein VGB63_16065 [Pedobacter sp.]|jgi:hypothetical protein